MSAALELRRASVDDAAAIAAISVRTWHHAYSDFVDPRTLAERTIELQQPRWTLRLQTGNEVWVAELDGVIAGYAGVAPSTDDDAQPRTGALTDLYVEPAAQGAGLGAQLHEHAITRLAEREFSAATLWSFAGNEQARDFYERRGWQLDPSGAGQEDPCWRDPAVRYRREF